MQLTYKSLCAALPLLLSSNVRAAQPDLVVADFEGGTYGAWKIECSALGTHPAQGALPNQMAVGSFGGAASRSSAMRFGAK